MSSDKEKINALLLTRNAKAYREAFDNIVNRSTKEITSTQQLKRGVVKDIPLNKIIVVKRKSPDGTEKVHYIGLFIGFRHIYGNEIKYVFEPVCPPPSKMTQIRRIIDENDTYSFPDPQERYNQAVTKYDFFLNSAESLYGTYYPMRNTNDIFSFYYEPDANIRSIAEISHTENLPIEVAGKLASFFRPKGDEPKGLPTTYGKEAQAKARGEQGGRRKTKKRLSKKRRHTNRK